MCIRDRTRVLGVTPEDIGQLAIEKGIPTILDYFTPTLSKNIKNKYGLAKIITAANVFAHMDNIGEILNSVVDLLKDDGRMCLNIPLDKNKGGKQSVYGDILKIAKNTGWEYNTTIIWNEQNMSKRTAWGSWLSASAPYVIAPVEIILIMYKENRKKSLKGKSTITKE